MVGLLNRVTYKIVTCLLFLISVTVTSFLPANGWEWLQ